MKRLYSALFLIFLAVTPVLAQEREDPPIPPDQTNLNKLDSKGKRQGMWLTQKEPRMGEPGISEFGNYDHGSKYGTWYKIDNFGDLVAIEMFKNNVLDGEVKYYEQGKLYCVGHYRGLNPKNKYDTVVVMHPVTQEEEYRVIPTDNGSLRHGNWKYYDPNNGHLIKEEEYQVDELIYKKDYEVSAGTDSIYRRKHEALMPHVTGKGVKLPAGKKVSYTSK